MNEKYVLVGLVYDDLWIELKNQYENLWKD
jgi:hypothetical protein